MGPEKTKKRRKSVVGHTGLERLSELVKPDSQSAGRVCGGQGGRLAMDELMFQKTLREEVHKIIARDIGEPESRFRKTPHALEEFDVEHLTNEEAELLFALEGEKSLAKVSQDLGWSPINVARILFGLISMDLVERTAEG